MKLTIDFETVDPYIGLNYGPGWVFALRGYKNPEFKLLGASLKIDDKPVFYYEDLNTIADIVSQADTFIMHNAMYDIGCLLVLFCQLGREFVSLKHIIIYDTMLMAKLVDQQQESYGLEACSGRHGIVQKSKETLTNFVWESGLYKAWYKEHYNINKRKRPSEALLFSYAIQNLDKLPKSIVETYCNADVEATYSIFCEFETTLKQFPQEFDWEMISTLIKAMVDIKTRGVRVDLEKVKETKQKLQAIVKQLKIELFEYTKGEFNLYSPAQVGNALRSLGITHFKKTKKGNDSVNKDWLDIQGHPACKLIVKIKNYEKLVTDFLIKLEQYQEIHRSNGSDDWRIFPNFNILGATSTGRMSSSGYKKDSFELNLQQIPKRGDDEDASRYVREVFIPERGEMWLSGDFSTQEQRLQVDYAEKLQLNGATSVAEILRLEPDTDFHTSIASMCNIDRTTAKTIGLGLSYGMGEVKLCQSLNLPTVKRKFSNGRIGEVAGFEGQQILQQYYSYMPFMKELQSLCEQSLQSRGYIKTIGGRKLYNEKPILWEGKFITFERKGMSKLIQGSAADVTMKAVVNAYNAGLKLLLVVHDEICISTGQPEKDMLLLKDNMEKTYNINVPMNVKMTIGNSWAGD